VASRQELVRMMVWDCVAYGPWNLCVITKWLAEYPEFCRMAVETSEILQALDELIRTGLAKARRFPSGIEIQGMPSVDEIGSPHEYGMDDAWFFATDEGMKLYADWPYDEQDWSPSES
jgi:hypothetical protein